MDSVLDKLQNLHITDNSIKGGDLSAEEELLEKTKKVVEATIPESQCDFFVVKQLCAFLSTYTICHVR